MNMSQSEILMKNNLINQVVEVLIMFYYTVLLPYKWDCYIYVDFNL